MVTTVGLVDPSSSGKRHVQKRARAGTRVPGASNFGGLLKMFRERRSKSQSKLAEDAGFDHSYVSRLESGAREPTRDAVDRLGEALALSQVERDALLAAAGFLPRDINSLLANEPVVGELLDILQNETLPEEYRENTRQMLWHLCQQARFVLRLSATEATT